MTDFKKAVRRFISALAGSIRRLMAAKLRVRAIRAASYATRRTRTPKQVVFVSDRPRSREAKLMFI